MTTDTTGPERPDPPDADFVPPDCGLCGATTEHVDDGFDCTCCRIFYDYYGHGSWQDDEEVTVATSPEGRRVWDVVKVPQCASTTGPHPADRCLLAETHVDLPVPVLGDDPRRHRSGRGWAWADGDDRVVTPGRDEDAREQAATDRLLAARLLRGRGVTA